MANVRINTHPEAQWFPRAGLGLFIHWGISSVDGYLDLSWGMMKDFKYSPRVCPPEEYFALAKRFNPGRYDARKWIKAAADAGCRYAVLTTRHHDSFALWPSRYGDFNTRTYMDGRDLLQPYVDACREYGLKVGFYYSPPDFRTTFEYKRYGGWYPEHDETPPKELTDYEHAIVRGQVRELLTRYGRIDLLWFDGQWRHIINEDDIRALQPWLVIGRGEDTDFATTECRIPTEEEYAEKFTGNWWEFCGELNCCWGYTRRDEYTVKSLETLVNWFTNVRAHGGNFLINIGPDSEGDFTPIEYERLAQLGEYVKAHPELMPEKAGYFGAGA
ncbi:MAG: alpha-L-fucosidase [Clostridia bacterium]|nr:alpha-L-fucosidase [Clostridia bacterium]